MRMTKQEFLTSSGVRVQTLEVWLDQKWLVPEQTDAGPHFSDRDMARARLILDLQNEMNVNDAGVDVILHLMDQLHGLRAALAQLRDTLPGSPPREE